LPNLSWKPKESGPPDRVILFNRCMKIWSLLLWTVLASAQTPAPRIEVVGPPLAEDVASSGSRLVAGADGRTYLSWVEVSEASARLCFARLEPAGWSPARTIAEGSNWMVNWADFPVLAVARDGSLAATWLERTGAEGTWDYGVRLAVSATGETWSKSVPLHADAAGPEHGFVSLVPLAPQASGEAAFGAVWLDSRGSSGGHEAGSMGLWFRRFVLGADGPELGPELELDNKTCECCCTSAIVTADGGVEMAYRDRAEGELRDIRVVRLGGAALFARGGPLSDGWKIAGCPVNGPALARWKDTRALVWFTLDQGLGHLGAGTPEPAVKVALSADGLRFGLPERVDGGLRALAMGRVAATFAEDGRLFVVWLESAPEASETPMARWMLRQMTGPAGARLAGGPPVAVALASVEASRASGFGSLVWQAAGPDRAAGAWFAFTRTSEAGPNRVETRFVSGL